LKTPRMSLWIKGCLPSGIPFIGVMIADNADLAVLIAE